MKFEKPPWCLQSVWLGKFGRCGVISSVAKCIKHGDDKAIAKEQRAKITNSKIANKKKQKNAKHNQTVDNRYHD
ncbi:hypothetical protein ACFBZI_09350 [Moraxella sp. ZJ142]|uniref:hypothetical protein n=1 Tax=Moraxella marmotae TaxID=3344520 RepID=UPI0035D45BDF